MKEKYMKAKSIDDLFDIEDEVFGKYRDDFYNELLKDDDVKKHICEIFGIPENAINNALHINGAPPFDDFAEEEIQHNNQ